MWSWKMTLDSKVEAKVYVIMILFGDSYNWCEGRISRGWGYS